MAENFWNGFDFRNASMRVTAGEAERIFGQFNALICKVSIDTAGRGIKKMMKGAETDCFTYSFFLGMSEKFWYNPNSAFRNEALFMAVLKEALASPVTDQTIKSRCRYLLEVCRKNQPGQPAGDFNFKLLSGHTGSMYAIKSRYLLLYFNNPGCHACTVVKDILAASPVIDRLQEDGSLKILAVYPDEDLTEWRTAAHCIPASWINACDPDFAIRKTELYDLRAIPCIYLLDSTKTVLLKDTSPEEVIRLLSHKK